MQRVKTNRWQIIEDKFDLEHIKHYETIFTLGNGYLGTRGTLDETYKESYPGTYIAGTFDQIPEEVTELPNAANWLKIRMELDGEVFDLKRGNILKYKRILNLKKGILSRNIIWESPTGKRTKLYFERFVSIDNQHIMGSKVGFTPLNYSGNVKYISSLDGKVSNSGTQHFIDKEKAALKDNKGIYLLQKTYQSEIEIVEAAFHNIKINDEKLISIDNYDVERRTINYIGEFEVEEGQNFSCEKLVSIYTSRDVSSAKDKAITAAQKAAAVGHNKLVKKHSQEWFKEWDNADVIIDGPDFDQLAVRFAIFHQLQMAHKNDENVSIAAKALSGEGYKGHVFWDNEIFNLPFFIYSYPNTAKTLLKYRYNTLTGAKKNAKEMGYCGAKYAWESANSGIETTPKWGRLDIETGERIRIWCGEIEEHITADVAYAIWHYYQATDDLEFLKDYGAEIFFETAKYWCDRLEYNKNKDVYEINNIIGPDEYSEHVNNNVYTNMLVKWNLKKASEIYYFFKDDFPEKLAELMKKTNLNKLDVANWNNKAEKIFINYDPDQKLYIQYDGFMDRIRLDDEIREAKSKGVTLLDVVSWKKISEESQVLKQSDVIMLQYLLSDKFDLEEKEAAWNLYEPQTMHDSSLSPAIHAIMASEIGNSKEAYHYYQMASDIDLTLGGSEAGLHAASFGGLWQSVVNGFAGMRIRDNKLTFKPSLPDVWKNLKFNIYWKKHKLKIYLDDYKMDIELFSDSEEEINIVINEEEYTISSLQTNTIVITR